MYRVLSADGHSFRMTITGCMRICRRADLVLRSAVAGAYMRPPLPVHLSDAGRWPVMAGQRRFRRMHVWSLLPLVFCPPRGASKPVALGLATCLLAVMFPASVCFAELRVNVLWMKDVRGKRPYRLISQPLTGTPYSVD